MVLIDRRGVLAALVAVALAGGCLPKKGAPVQAATPTSTALSSVLQELDTGNLSAVPDALSERLTGTLTARNLVPAGPGAAVPDEYRTKRTAQQRLAWMAETEGDAEPLVLVETQVEFYSQMNGRFRWTVSVDLSVAPRDDLAQTVSASFTVPVFLQFHHEQEPEALAQAALVIERLGYLLDEVLSGLNP